MLPRVLCRVCLVWIAITGGATTVFAYQALDRAASGTDEPQTPESRDDRGAVLSRRDLAKRLAVARNLIAEERFAEALPNLQRVLDNPQDEYCSLPDPAAGEMSAKSTAEELLLSLPDEVLDFYEKQNGPTARKLLDQAVREFGSLDPVIDRYLHTQAGYEALYRQATAAWEVGQPQVAAIGYDRLRQIPRAARGLEPSLSLRAAAAWMQVGDPDRATRILEELRSGRQEGAWQIAGRKVPAGEAGQTPDWLTRLKGDGVGAQRDDGTEWWNWRGNRQRNGGGVGGAPYLNHGWKVETLADLPRDSREGRLVEITSDLVQSARLENESSPAMTIGAPLVVRNLVIFRTLWDLRAVDRVTGKPVWFTTEKDQQILDLLRPGGLPQSNQTQGSTAEMLVAQRFWVDANYNGLSSDGERIYTVEDLGYVGVMLPNRVTQPAPQHNRLVAYDVRSGRLLWEAGAPPDASQDPLAGVFFLGPPLAWQGLLYAIVDIGSTPQLAVIQPRTGQLEVLQPLGSDEPDLAGFDRSRAYSGLTPSCDNGLMLCPTGPDFVTAYDPGRRRLSWRYRFRPRTEAPGPRHQMMLMQQQLARNSNRIPEQSGWIDYAGVIDSGRALYSPRDSDELFCLNLADGSLAWKVARGGGLYVAGVRNSVVLVVGRNFIQGLRLADGAPAWTSPTMLPTVTGRGCLSDQSYLVPLASGEVAAVDVNDGRILTRAKSFTGQIPGSLVMAGGTVVSQRYDIVSGFRQVEALQAEITARLAVEPDHPESLTVRGQMRLERGEFAEALADLERAVTLAPESTEARTLLLTALLEGLRTDFSRYHTFGPRAGELVGQGSERAQFHWLMALGYEQMGNRPAAFTHLLAFGDPQVQDRELERVQSALLIRRDRQVSVAAQRVLHQATDTERGAMEGQLAEAATAALASSDPAHGLRFLHYFGTLLPDRAARIAAQPPAVTAGPWLDSEFEIRRALNLRATPVMPRLLAEWGDLLARAERYRDLAVMADWLERSAADREVSPGVTGRSLADTWRGRPELERLAALRHEWPTGKVETERLPGVRPVSFGRTQPIPLDGPRAPFLAGVTLELGTGDQQLIARDGRGKPLWKLPLDAPIWTGNAQFNRAWVRDHLLILLIGKDLLAVDLLGSVDEPGPRWLWHQNLIEGSAAIMVQRGLPSVRGRVNFAPLGPDNTAVVGPVTYNHLTVLRGRRLSVLDPLTGQTLWMREGVSAGAGLFGDDELLFVVPPDAHEAQIFNMDDGSSAGSRRLPPSNWWLEPLGRHLVVWGRPLDKQVLALRDVQTDRDLWSREFAPGSFVALVESEEAIVIDPAGRATCVSLADGSVRFETDLAPQDRMNELLVLRTHDQYLLIANEPLPTGPTIVRHSQNVHQTVNGTVHALDRTTGRRLWSTQLERQQIDPQQPTEIPLLTFASHVFEPRRVGNGLEQRFLLTSLDRRTGQLLYEESRSDEPLHFIDYRIDEDASTIELQLFQSVVRFSFTGKSSTPE